MKNAVYVTTAKPSEGSGGGVVALHEIKALNPSLVVSMSEQSPFLNDYFCFWKIKNEVPFELAHFYGTPFGLTAEYLKKQGTRILATVPAHNLERSVEEHIKLCGQYPYNHMTDPYLWSLYSHHIKIADTVICPSKTSADYIKQKLQLQKDPTIIGERLTTINRKIFKQKDRIVLGTDMKITVTYSCSQCGFRYTETINVDARKKTRACHCCGEPEILVVDPMPEKLVYAT